MITQKPRQMLYFLKSQILSCLVCGLIPFLALPTQAQIISPQAVEVQFSYQTSFRANSSEGLSKEDFARFHASHLFGLFQSPRLIRSLGLNPERIAGIGAPRNDTRIRILSSKKISNEKIEISYSLVGRMILQKKVADLLLPKGGVTLPLPADPYEIYDVNCTDPHYDTFSDYWYFYDPFRFGCERLARSPYSQDVVVRLTALRPSTKETSPRLDLLRGDNGNGETFLISVIHGYYESSTNPSDEGRENFNQFNAFLNKNGFTESRKYDGTSRPLSIFRKRVLLANGHGLNIEIKHLLVETNIGSRTISFAQFFKDAVENADVIIYGGHSGLGGNLDIPSLEAKAGRFKFNANKRQIFYFDSCSSYSYYLANFTAEKTKARIDVLSNGLSSDFLHSEAILEVFMQMLINPKVVDLPWLGIMQQMEKPLDGGSYLLNVGGV